MISRRTLLQSAGAYGLLASPWSLLSANAQGASSLRDAGRRTGRLIGIFTVAHMIQQEPQATALLAREFSMVADGNDLKFSDRLRPTPDTFDFSNGDAVANWAHTHGIAFRGHCLVWWDALPKWFASYVNSGNARQVMTDHITKVVRHYAGQVYSWDVVNEPIYHDNRPDGLRRKPWLDTIGPDYIDIAFHAAAAADPHSRLVLNECYVEHATPGEVARRAQLLALLTRLRKSGVPITGLGLQSHLRGNVPIDKPGMLVFLKQVHDLGLDIMITELDVDDVDVPGSAIDDVVTRKYVDYINMVGPYASSISFQWLTDLSNQPRRPDGQMHRPNLFDPNFNQKSTYGPVIQAISNLPRFAAH